MAIGFPTKANWAAGDVLTASAMDDLAGTVNLLNPTAKGGIVAGTGANTTGVLTVGADGQILVANSSQTTGLAYTNNFAAGKNKIINGDFGIWQRGTTFTSPSFNQYLADRWKNNNYDFAPTTYSFTQQTFTPATAPVAGYEGTYFGRSLITTVGTNTQYDTFQQRVEDVRVFAGQTATLSFWAKSDSSRTQQIAVAQNFGSGGSTEVSVNSYGTNNFTTTTSWQRFTFTLSIPNISGKTVGSSSYLYFAIRQASASGSQLDLWGAQWEAGSVATAFQTATGTVQGELAACQRYFSKSYQQTTAPQTTFTNTYMFVPGTSTIPTSTAYGCFALPVTMRTLPTITFYSVAAGTAGVVTNAAGTDLAANSANSTYIGDNHFSVKNNSGALITPSSGGFIFEYIASAEL